MRFCSHPVSFESKVIYTFRYPLRPTQAQAAVLETWLWRCRQLYNGALEERKSTWKLLGKSPTRYDQQKSLTVLRSEDREWAEIPAVVARSALKRVDLGMKAFAKTGKKPGFPRFKGRDRYDSFSLGFAPKIEPRSEGVSARIYLSKLGPVKFHEYRPLKGKILDVIVKREVGKWFVFFQCDLGAAPPKVAVKAVTGIDLGLSSFAVLSDGTSIENPRLFRKGKSLLARRQQALQLKRRGSKSRQRAKQLVQRAHLHVSNQRKDFACKTAKALVDKFDLIAHEDLQIKNMAQGHFAKSINDAAWGLFLHCLSCKAEEAGKTVVAVDPRGTTQRCSGCGVTVPKELSQRTHVCDRCGLVLGRDHNASLNIKGLGLSLVLDRGSRSKLKPYSFGQSPRKARSEKSILEVV